jgi:hypothetical protein
MKVGRTAKTAAKYKQDMLRFAHVIVTPQRRTAPQARHYRIMTPCSNSPPEKRATCWQRITLDVIDGAQAAWCSAALSTQEC